MFLPHHLDTDLQGTRALLHYYVPPPTIMTLTYREQEHCYTTMSPPTPSWHWPTGYKNTATPLCSFLPHHHDTDLQGTRALLHYYVPPPHHHDTDLQGTRTLLHFYFKAFNINFLYHEVFINISPNGCFRKKCPPPLTPEIIVSMNCIFTDWVYRKMSNYKGEMLWLLRPCLLNAGMCRLLLITRSGGISIDSCVQLAAPYIHI